jgi:hypothetical protein
MGIYIQSWSCGLDAVGQFEGCPGAGVAEKNKLSMCPHVDDA